MIRTSRWSKNLIFLSLLTPLAAFASTGPPGSAGGGPTCSQAVQKATKACCIQGNSETVCKNNRSNADALTTDSTDGGTAGALPNALNQVQTTADNFLQQCSSPAQTCATSCKSDNSASSIPNMTNKQVCNQFETMVKTAQGQKDADAKASPKADDNAKASNDGKGGGMPSMPSPSSSNSASNSNNQQTPIPAPSGSGDCTPGVSPVGCCPGGAAKNQDGSCSTQANNQDQSNAPQPAGFAQAPSAASMRGGLNPGGGDSSGGYDGSSGSNPTQNFSALPASTSRSGGGSSGLPGSSPAAAPRDHAAAKVAAKELNVSERAGAGGGGGGGGFPGYGTDKEASGYGDYLPGQKKAPTRGLASVAAVSHPDIVSVHTNIFENVTRRYQLKCHFKELRGCQ